MPGSSDPVCAASRPLGHLVTRYGGDTELPPWQAEQLLQPPGRTHCLGAVESQTHIPHPLQAAEPRAIISQPPGEQRGAQGQDPSLHAAAIRKLSVRWKLVTLVPPVREARVLLKGHLLHQSAQRHLTTHRALSRWGGRYKCRPTLTLLPLHCKGSCSRISPGQDFAAAGNGGRWKMTTTHDGPARTKSEARQKGPGGKVLKLSCHPASCCPSQSFHRNNLLFKLLNVGVFPSTTLCWALPPPQLFTDLIKGNHRCPQTSWCDCHYQFSPMQWLYL